MVGLPVVRTCPELDHQFLRSFDRRHAHGRPRQRGPTQRSPAGPAAPSNQRPGRREKPGSKAFRTIKSNHLKATSDISGSLDLTTDPSNPRNNVGPPDHGRTWHSARHPADRRQPQRVTQLLPLLVLDAIPPTRSRIGPPRCRPGSLFANRGYDHDVYRDQVRERGIVPAMARRGTPHGTGLGAYRWVIGRSFAGLHGFQRLQIRIRWERRAGIHEALLNSPAA